MLETESVVLVMCMLAHKCVYEIDRKREAVCVRERVAIAKRLLRGQFLLHFMSNFYASSFMLLSEGNSLEQERTYGL